jgi:hypothetical protein
MSGGLWSASTFLTDSNILLPFTARQSSQKNLSIWLISTSVKFLSYLEHWGWTQPPLGHFSSPVSHSTIISEMFYPLHIQNKAALVSFTGEYRFGLISLESYPSWFVSFFRSIYFKLDREVFRLTLFVPDGFIWLNRPFSPRDAAVLGTWFWVNP